jgi:phosphatidate cytidylyltransferase
MHEFYRISIKERIRAQKNYGIFIGTLFFISNYLFAQKIVDYKIYIILLPLLFFIFINELYRKNKKPFSNIAYTLLGIFYIALPLSTFNFFVFHSSLSVNYSPNILLGFFILLWATDTGAYIFGVSLGKHKLFPRISPKKSWEGFFGGAITSLTTAYIISTFFIELPLIHWVVISLIIIIMGTFGDLVESLFKRSIHIKDSGKIFPGHGGILDRIDSVLLSAPIIFTYLQLIN